MHFTTPYFINYSIVSLNERILRIANLCDVLFTQIIDQGSRLLEPVSTFDVTTPLQKHGHIVGSSRSYCVQATTQWFTVSIVADFVWGTPLDSTER